MSYSEKFKTKISPLTDYNIMAGEDGNEIYKHKTIANKKFIKPIGLKRGASFEYLEYSNNRTDPTDVLLFSIHQFYKKTRDNNRLYVIIYCNNVKTGSMVKSVYYASISDGSFWRFCIKANESKPRLDKGYNYISTTFINIYLQKFIFAFMRSFEIQDNHTNTIDCVDSASLESIRYLDARIFTERFVYPNDFFLIINEIFPPVTHFMNYNRCLIRLLDKMSNLIVSNDSSSIDKINICSDIFCLLNGQKLNRNIELTEETSRRVFFNKIRDVFSDLFLIYFTLKQETKEIIFTNNFSVGTFSFVVTIYSMDIVYKLNNEIFILYYMIYSSTRLTKKIKTFLYIIPKDNSITQYGLDNYYVAGGVLINKIFDYPKQSPITVLSGHVEHESLHYRFIGDLTNYNFLPE